MRDFDALVVGGGVVGAVIAALLLERDLAERGRVALIDDRLSLPSEPDADWDLRVVALSRASERLLELVGAWGRLPSARVSPYERMCVWDARGVAYGTGSIAFDCADLGEPNLGSIVEARALRRASLEAAVAAGVVTLEGRIERLETLESGVRLRLGDGRELETRLLLAADGVESKTRALLGIDLAGHAYDQDALVAHVRTARPHRATAWQRFLPTGPLAFLPLSDGRSSIVWSVERREAERLRALSPRDFAAALERASDGVLGAIELTTKVVGVPLILQQAERYIAPHAALLGDAAHVVHPLAGQGLNLGLLDCAALAEVLEGGGAGGAAGARLARLDDPQALRRYERWRRSENGLAAAAFDGLERLFSSANPLAARLRAFGLETVGRLPAVKMHLARRALGLAGDVPELVRREASR